MSALLTSYDVESGVKSTFKTGITAAATTGLIIKRALNITSGVFLVNRGGSTQEWISFNSVIVNGSETTLGDVVRGLALSGNTFVGSSLRAYAHGSAETVELVDYHILLNLKANVDRVNTFSAAQTISGINKLFLNDANSWIYDDGVDIRFKSSAQAEVTLASLANGSGVNDKAKVSSNDTTTGYLSAKINPGAGLVGSITSPGGNEVWNLDVNLESVNPTLQIATDQLGLKIKASSGLAVDASGVYVDPTTLTGLSATDIVTNLVYDEAITLGDAVELNGLGHVVQGNADALNETFLFAGVAKASGTATQTKQVAVPGPVVTISVPLSAAGGRQWTGQSNATSNTTTDEVYGVNWRSQGFTPAAGEINVKSVSLNMTSVGTPTGTYTLGVYATASGLPTGAALGTATLAVSAMATGENVFTFSTAVAVTAGTVYALVLSNATALVSNNFKWNYQNSGNVYAGGTRGTSSDSGSNWSGDTNADYRFIVKYESVYGEPVFLSTTDGAFTLTPPSNSAQYVQKVGWALSTTQIVLNPGVKCLYATYNYTSTASGTTDTTLTIGFRPMMIFGGLTIPSLSGSGKKGSMGMWMNANAATGFSLENKDVFTSSNAALQQFGRASRGLMYYNGLVGASGPVPADYTEQTLTVNSSGADTVTIRRVVTATGAPSDATTIDLLILGF